MLLSLILYSRPVAYDTNVSTKQPRRTPVRVLGIPAKRRKTPMKSIKSKIRDWKRVYHEPIPDFLYSVNNDTGSCCDDNQQDRR